MLHPLSLSNAHPHRCASRAPGVVRSPAARLFLMRCMTSLRQQRRNENDKDASVCSRHPRVPSNDFGRWAGKQVPHIPWEAQKTTARPAVGRTRPRTVNLRLPYPAYGLVAAGPGGVRSFSFRGGAHTRPHLVRRVRRTPHRAALLLDTLRVAVLLLCSRGLKPAARFNFRLSARAKARGSVRLSFVRAGSR